MTTHFISAEINLSESPVELAQAIATELEQRGEPLRWAITDVNEEAQTVSVEAVVTVDSNSTPVA